MHKCCLVQPDLFYVCSFPLLAFDYFSSFFDLELKPQRNGREHKVVLLQIKPTPVTRKKNVSHTLNTQHVAEKVQHPDFENNRVLTKDYEAWLARLIQNNYL